MTKNGSSRCFFGQKRVYLKTIAAETVMGHTRYLIGQHPLSLVFDQKRPGTSDYSYFAQFLPIFGHFMSLSGGLLDLLEHIDTHHENN